MLQWFIGHVLYYAITIRIFIKSQKKKEKQKKILKICQAFDSIADDVYDWYAIDAVNRSSSFIMA